ncbi:MAG TPA: FeoA family protein [Aequorivita sp.]|nr:FeoA family protein [Aequorivita sp.]
MATIASLKIGQRGVIKEFLIDLVPLKLMEMGCLPGNEVELIQIAPFKDPLYIVINDTHLSIRLETAEQIEIDII